LKVAVGSMKMDEELFVDDLFDMEDDQLQHEAERYARLARFGPEDPKIEYRFAYHRHKTALELLEARKRK
jgi:hypothetical protein